MATAEQVKLTVLVKLTSLGRPLYHPAEAPEAYAAYEAEYIEALKAFERDTLIAAMERVRAEWSALTWPPPGRIVQACIAVERERREARPERGYRPPLLQLPPPPEETPVERQAVRLKLKRLHELMASDGMSRMTGAEARRFCETGDYPEGWEARAVQPRPPRAPQVQPPGPHQQARDAARKAAFEADAAAARAAFLGVAPPPPESGDPGAQP